MSLFNHRTEAVYPEIAPDKTSCYQLSTKNHQPTNKWRTGALAALILVCSYCPSAFAALSSVSETFEDGDITANPTWSGNTTLFVVNSTTPLVGTRDLRCNTAGAVAVISTPIGTSANLAAGDCTWSFVFQDSQGNPGGTPASSTNGKRTWLAADGTDPTTAHGYAIRYGNSSTPDNFVLVKMNAGTETVLVTGIDPGTAIYSIKVTRSAAGLWTLYMDSGTSGATTARGTATTDTTYLNSGSSTISMIIQVSNSTGTGNPQRFRWDNIVFTAPATATAPTVGSPTKASVVDTSATLGATVTANGGASVDDYGVVLAPASTTTTPTVSNTKFPKGTTESLNTAYTVSATSLTPGTQYYYGGYAHNSVGYAYSSYDLFYTLSTEPSAHVGSFNAAAASSSSIGLSWTPASGANGYLILQRSGASAPTGVPTDATGYSVGTTIGDGTVAAVVTPGSATSTTISGLSASSPYSYAIFPFAWNGGNAATYNYLTAATVPTASASTTALPATKMTVTLPGQASANTGSPASQTAGTTFNVTLTATTDGTTIDSGYGGTKTVVFTGPTGSPSYPANVSFTSGIGTASITLTKAETTAITATEGVYIGVASSSLLVNPGVIASYTVTATSPQTAGGAFTTTVTAKDSNNNTVTTDSSTVVTMSGTGSVQFDSDGNGTFGDVTKPLTGGTFTISTKDNVAEAVTITATDSTQKTGSSSSITVNPGAIDHFAVSASSPQQIGIAFLTTVTAKDANNNTVATDSSTSVTMSGTGSVTFDSDGNGTFGDVTKSLASGTFTISTKDVAAETITVTATANSKTGTSGSIVIAIPQYRSKTTGNWNATTTWQKSLDGGLTWVDATATPTSADDTIEIQNGHTVTVTASVSADQVTVDAGGQITVNSGTTLAIANGAGTDLDVPGTVEVIGTLTINSSAAVAVESGGVLKNSDGTVNTTGALTFNSNSKYQHNCTSTGAIPTATWNTGSTCEIIGYTSTGASPGSASGFGQSFYNFIWNCPNQTAANINLSGNLTTVNGDFTVANTGSSGSLRLTGNGALTLNIGGNLNLPAGILNVSSGSGGPTINLTGNLSIAGGTLDMGNGATGTDTLNVLGNVAVTSGTLKKTSSSPIGNIVFNKSGTQTFTSGGTISGVINWKINSSSTLDIGTSTVGGTGTFTVDNGGTLKGSGTIAGAMTVNSAGTVSPGNASIGILTLNSTPTLTGAVAMDVDKTSGTTSADQIARIGGTLAFGGMLTISKTGADALNINDSFPLFTKSSGSFSGWFSTVTLPTLTSGLTWDTNGLATTGILSVYAFTTAASQTMTANTNTTTKLLIAKVLSKTSGGRGPLTLLSTSGGTGTITSDGTYLFYTPQSGVASDSFNCLVQDVNGATTTVTVNVTVFDPSNPTSSGNGSNLTIVDNMDGTVRIVVSGTAGVNFQLEYSTSLVSPNWQNLGDAFLMPSVGLVNITDPIAAGSRYYRTVLP